MKKYASILLAIVLCLVLSSCGNQQNKTDSSQQSGTVNTSEPELGRDKALIGEWSGTLNSTRFGYTFEPAPAMDGKEVKVTLRFDEDGYCQFGMYEYIWSTKGNELILSSSSLRSPYLTYSVSGNKLEITSTQDYSATRTFTKE